MLRIRRGLPDLTTDTIIVVRTDYDGHGEKQSFQNSVDSLQGFAIALMS
ncbi:MAG: hypothetical protein AB4426_02535 [Xenococcaceae cyanobacterium]